MRLYLLFLSFYIFLSIFFLCCKGSFFSNDLIDNFVTTNATKYCPLRNSYTKMRTRRKRSLTFPKGSAFVLTMSIVKAIQLKVPANWNLDLEFDMIWPIPKGISPRKPGWKIHRRHRRELYSNFELALNSQGLPGKSCILRTICEIKFLLNPPGISLVEDIIRVIFSYPANSVLRRDPYDIAQTTEDNCDIIYPCPFSFLALLLNYNTNEF